MIEIPVVKHNEDPTVGVRIPHQVRVLLPTSGVTMREVRGLEGSRGRIAILPNEVDLLLWKAEWHASIYITVDSDQ